jgi:hypothetical protein
LRKSESTPIEKNVKLNQPVAGGAVIDRSDEDRVRRGLSEIRDQPFLRLADIDFMIERKHHVVEHDIMAAVWRAARDDPGSRRCARNRPTRTLGSSVFAHTVYRFKIGAPVE